MTTDKLAGLKLSLGVLGFAALVATTTMAGSTALLDRQHMLLVHGQPRFILGLYENPKDDAVLKEAIDSGFNLIQCGANAAALDRVQRYGAMAWVNVGGELDLSQNADARRKQLCEVAQRLSQHPALLVWEGPDEILWNNWWGTTEALVQEFSAMRTTAADSAELRALMQRTHDLYDRGLYLEFQQTRVEFWTKAGRPDPHAAVRIDDAPDRVRRSGDGILAGIQTLRAADSSHVIWLNHAPRNSLKDLALYNRAADMAGCDIYPAPPNCLVGHSDLRDTGLTSVGAYTDRMRAAAPGKACAMVLQGFGWSDLKEHTAENERSLGIGRRPTYAESRFMAYDAVIHGANAILYWGTAYNKPTDQKGNPDTGRSRLWRDLLRVARELSALEPALVAPPLKSPTVRHAETYGSIDDAGILCTLRRVRDDYVLIVVNESCNGLRFTVSGLPRKLDGRAWYRLGSAPVTSPSHGQFTDGIKACDVQVYSTTRRFEAQIADVAARN